MIIILMIGALLGVALASLSFWLTKRQPTLTRCLIAGVILLGVVAFILFNLSKISDDPPADSRIVTQEEIQAWGNKESAIEPGTLRTGEPAH